ncbi:MAG: glutamine-hydrolyzing GMP synthase [Cytophagaceae bacterium]|nr:glutamine-hydrolyzing GMP synthase [Cytophagaceae bacterium]
MTQQEILIIDFGSQYTQLIARRVRELHVYCEIHPFHKIPEITSNIKGIILSVSPSSVREEGSPNIDMSFRGKVPVLGICYGAQLLAIKNGGNVEASETREYGRAFLHDFDNSNHLFDGIKDNTQVWMSHGDSITALPTNSRLLASTNSVKNAGFVFNDELTFGIQFHPEVTHSEDGKKLLQNFVVNICGCDQSYTAQSFVEATVTELKDQLKDDKVVLGLSGGVDSSYKGMGLNVVGVDAKNRFYDALKGKTDPEEKRKAIGKTFIEVFDDEAHKIQDVKWLAQGTIYPDIIESVSVKGPSMTIKSHHNVGGLPDYMKLKIVEPLKLLFKDGVREVGASMGMPQHILGRHPFPGPGLGIRILGEVTPEKVQILQEVDAIFINGLKETGLYEYTWQAGAMLLPVQSVGVMGDERTYESVVALRAVTSVDGMTADWAHLPYDFLGEVSNKIINKVKGVNRVVYDISSKPPATIEWE